MDTGEVVACVGIGANVGKARAAVHGAMTAMASLPQVRLVAQSSLYGSTPVDATGDDYVNAVVKIHTTLSALDLLHALQALELSAGRTRPYVNAPRTLDLDLLLYGTLVLDTAELTVPHPRLWQRAFVLLPLAEIAPELVPEAALQAVRQQAVWRLAPA